MLYHALGLVLFSAFMLCPKCWGYDRLAASKNSVCESDLISLLDTDSVDRFDIDRGLYVSGKKLSDIVGQGLVKEEAIEVVDAIKNSDIYARFGAKLPNVITIKGPSGVGKKLLVESIAGESDSYLVDLQSIDYSEISEFCENLSDKSIIFFSGNINLASLKPYISGLKNKNVLFARVKDLVNESLESVKDDSIREKVIYIPSLDYDARFGLLKKYIAKTKASESIFESESIDNIARAARGLGAHKIKELVNEAAISAAKRYSINGNKESSITEEDLYNSLDKISKNKDEKKAPYSFCYRQDTSFKDFIGNKHVLREVKEFVDILKDFKSYESIGIKRPKGLLLYGPPGCGKTLLARAVAGEAGCCFIPTSASQFVEKFVGSGPGAIRALFEFASSMARNRPVILFFDELDAFGKRGTVGDGGDREYNNTINELLTQLDGFNKNENIFIIGATNNINLIDQALIRDGRFDRRLEITLPSVGGRKDILSHYLKKVKLENKIDIDLWARETHGYSGASLEKLVNESALNALREKSKIIRDNDFESAFLRNIAGVRSSIKQTSEELKKTALHEAAHALVAIKCGYDVPRISILSRSNALGIACKIDKHEVFSDNSGVDLLNNVKIMLAGFCAEKIVYKTVTPGVSDDLKKADELIYYMVHSCGMSENRLSAMTSRFIRSQEVLAEFDKSMMKLKQNCLSQTEILLKNNLETLFKLRDLLLEKETLRLEDLSAFY